MQGNFEAVAAPLFFALLVGGGLVWVAAIRRLIRREPLVAFEPCAAVPWTGRDLAILAITLLFCEIAAAALAERAALVTLALGLASGGSATGRILVELAGGPEEIPPAFLLVDSILRLAWLDFAVVYLVLKTRAGRHDLGFVTEHLGRDLRLGGLVFLAALVPVFAVQGFFVYVLDMPSEHPLLKLTQDEPRVAILALATFAAVGVAPVFEEFVFRVVFQGWLEGQQMRFRELRGAGSDSRPGFAPIVITSVVFAMLHFGHGPDPLALFVLSLFLGYAYRQTHRIFPSLVVHFSLNAWTMLNLWLMFFDLG